MTKPTQSLLRDHIVPPKATFEHCLKNAESRIAFDQLQDEIWRALLSRLQQPIKNIPSKQHRIVEVLGCIRYYIKHDTGEIHARARVRAGKTSTAFEPEKGTFLVVHPFRLTEPLITAFISEWKTEIVKATHRFITLTKFESIFVKSLLRAVRQSVRWKQLRYQVQKALGIDSQILDIARRARVVRHKNNLDDTHLNRVITHLGNYQQLNRDNPNSLWLYTLTLQELIELPKGELVQALKKRCIDAGCTARGWRLIAKSQLRDFAPAVEFSGKKWKYLIQYLKLHNTLDLNAVIPRKAAHLFDDPIWYIEDNGTVTYRDVNLAPALLNSYISEATKQTDINAFLTTDATAVFVWLAEAKPKLDSNQLRLGWQWLSQEANHWLVERAAHAELTSVRWDCGLGATTIGQHKFTPLSNAWQVRQEALRYRHCADNYIDRCVAGTYRLYSIHDKLDKHKATLGLEFYEGHGWEVQQIKGFANKVVSQRLKDLAELLTAGLDIVDEGATKRATSAQSKILTKRSEIIDATKFNVVAIDSASDAEVEAILESGAYDFEVNDYGTISFAEYVEPATREEAYGYSVDQLQNIDDLQSFADSSTLNYRLQRIYELELDDEPEDPDYGWITWLKESPDESRELIYAEVEKYFEEAPDYNDADYLPDTANAQGAAYQFFHREDWDLLDQLGIVIVEGDCPGSSYFAAELTIPVAEANQRAKVLDVAYRFKAEA